MYLTDLATVHLKFSFRHALTICVCITAFLTGPMSTRGHVTCDRWLRTGMTTSFVQTWTSRDRNGTTCNHLQEVGYHKSRYTCRLVVRLFSKRRRRFDGQEHSAINVHKTLDVTVGSLTDVVQTL